MKHRKVDLKRRYNLSLGLYHWLGRWQKRRCLICGEKMGPSVALQVDHDHETGQIRGLLCRACNLGLGMFRDNQILMRRAIEYLEGKCVPSRIRLRLPWNSR